MVRFPSTSFGRSVGRFGLQVYGGGVVHHQDSGSGSMARAMEAHASVLQPHPASPTTVLYPQAGRRCIRLRDALASALSPSASGRPKAILSRRVSESAVSWRMMICRRSSRVIVPDVDTVYQYPAERNIIEPADPAKEFFPSRWRL